jgi:16S rRNA (cytosine967-C5)-methyltransferase
VRFDIAGTKLFREGAIAPQSRAAMLVSRVLDPKPGGRVLDICAAPGGKTTHIAALMNGQGRIVAVEQNRKRAHQMEAVLARSHARNITVRVADATLPQPAGEKFDAVLLDAPCSGLGTLQAHPDLRWRASPQRITALAELQCKILAAAADAVRDGGRLVYSTCTLSRAENEQQIEHFLDSRPDFALDSATTPAPDAAGVSPDPFIVTLPYRDRTAGFFVARMRRG